MILLDFNQLYFATVNAFFFNREFDEDTQRHLVLNCIRAYRKKWTQKYGPLIICCDSRDYWRRKAFPYYKSHRKEARESGSAMDWKRIFAFMDTIKTELRETFPYPLIEVEGAEADDIIATMVSTNPDEKILILSGDKDFIQLHNENVQQYSEIKKTWIKHPNPKEYLAEHIIRGDTGDGIPNMRSPGSALATKTRQQPITQNYIDLVNSDIKSLSDAEQERYRRNEMLIDLTKCPDDIKQSILTIYNQEVSENKDRSKIRDYFRKHRLKELTSDLGDF